MTKAELITSIYAAFKDVHLEDGIGLYEADCLDEYRAPTDPVYISWKLRDERESWEKILHLFLNDTNNERVNSSNFFFMDAKGKRFHLPCYLLQDLDEKHKGNNPLITDLTYNIKSLSDCEILDSKQKQTLLDFFDHKLAEFINDGNEFDFDSYTQAKENFQKYIL